MALTIRDVAERAGVSISTASMVLQVEPDSRITKATQERVRQAAQELHYRPNLAARSLRSRKTFVIGMIMNRLKWHDCLEFIFPVEGLFRPRNYHVFMGFSHGDPAEEQRYVEEMTHGRVDGLILQPADRGDSGSLDYCTSLSIPVVVIEGPDGLDLPSVKKNRAEGIAICVRHLHGLGRRHIGLGMISEGYSGNERLEGYRRVLSELQLPFEKDLILPGGCGTDLFQVGYQLAVEVVEVPRMDAIICSNDLYAVGLIDGLRERGLRVPQDISVVGFTNLPSSRYNPVPLTTLDQQYERIGRTAAEMLWERIQAGEGELPPPVEQVSIVPKLIVRESCGAGLVANDGEASPVADT